MKYRVTIRETRILAWEVEADSEDEVSHMIGDLTEDKAVLIEPTTDDVSIEQVYEE